MLRFLFPISLFLSSLLLFSIQPMVAKALLPVYGGTPAVWIVCMLFFQLILLVSYAYAWWLSSFKKLAWRWIHIGVVGLSFSALPLVFHSLSMNGQPEWAILYNLISQLGLPLLVVSASAPLLQFAYSQTVNKRAADPYFLYAASNLGSLIALLSYPWGIERFMGLACQFYVWNVGYAVYLTFLLAVLFCIPYIPVSRQPEQAANEWSWGQILYWVFLSFIPCSLMLAVTLYITTDVAATPLFWVVPLALYLISFIVTFTTKPLVSLPWINRNKMFFLLFTLLGFILGSTRVPAGQFIVFNLLSFFVLAVLCHGQLVQSRPRPHHLTLFYFCLALGGVSAGIFNGILALHWFNQIYEYPLAILFSVLVFPKIKTREGWWSPAVVLLLLLSSYFLSEIHWPQGLSTFQIAAVVSLILIVLYQNNNKSLFLSLLFLLAFIFLPMLGHRHVLLQQRNFYGVKQVFAQDSLHVLLSQSTVHGLQNMSEQHPTGYTSYYGATQAVMDLMHHQFSSLTATLIGLGTGTMLCNFQAADRVQVIEIDQQMIDLAHDPKLFTFMRDCSSQRKLIQSDGRLGMAQLTNGSQNIIILDAFNSDSIPIHLMTREAFALYQKKLAPGGVLLINLSNRYLDLMPVINAMGHSLDLIVLYVNHRGDPKLGQLNSEWALLTSNEQLAIQLMKSSTWRFFANNSQFLWTDDYSNIIPLLK